jgi:hypothetical protein
VKGVTVMKQLNLGSVNRYIEDNIGSFHAARLRRLEELKLTKLLKAKNPYLFKAKNVMTGHDLVKTLLDAYLSSQEEALFGEFLEGLAVHVCGQVYGGKKSAAEGIDLQFEKDAVIYLVAVKSGPNWGNSGQIANMKSNFIKAKRILKTNNPKVNVQAVNGCCYGKDIRPDKGEYDKLCGQRFWSFISGNDDLYVQIIEPLGHKAKQRNDSFQKLYAQVINKFEREVLKDFIQDDLIDWPKLVHFNSGY